MANIKINQHILGATDLTNVMELCPFGAIEINNSSVSINAGCKMCKLCVKNGPTGGFEFVEDEVIKIDKSLWKGVCVYVDHDDGIIHPITYELIGKAKILAAKINHPVHAVFIGSHLTAAANELLFYGIDKIFVYDYAELKHFRIEPYSAAFEDYVNANKPSICLIGGTTVGRSLAPRMAARFRTGLTADCTTIDVQENTDLDQIRPAFGGNIMAHIHTPNHRPQFATVRYKIFDSMEKGMTTSGKIIMGHLDQEQLYSNIEVINVHKKEKTKHIEDAEIIVVAGRAIKKREDLKMIEDLAERLGGMVATTRPLIEAGWADPRRQIGLSGRTVKPRLIITCGVSGAIQFVAGMNSADTIIAINNDPSSPIFSVAHYALIGDVYEIIPLLLEKLNQTNNLVETLA